MKLLRYEQNGEPWDVVRLVEAPSPVAGPGEAVVRLEAAAVHIADLKAIRGELAFVPQGPAVPGFEGVGRIVACGPGVTGWRVGARALLPLGYGAWAEERAVPADGLWRAPEDAPAEQLALVRVNLVTADLLLHAYVPLGAGDWVIQNAANSNVGHYLDALAGPLGIRVINVVRRPELVASLEAAGRRHVLVDGPDLAGRVAAIVDRRPRLVLDAVGGEATTRLGQCVADGGLVLAFGFAGEQAYRIDYPDMMFRDVRLQGMMTDRAMARLDAAGIAAMEARVTGFMAAMGSSAPPAPIAGVYPFARIAEALRHAAGRGAERAGKVILTPG